MALRTTTRPTGEDEAHWVSTADLMAGLMIVFLLVAIVLMRQTNEAKERAERAQEEMARVIQAWQLTKEQIYLALKTEFDNDLLKWDAEIDANTLTFRFSKPEVLFASGEDTIQPRFDGILQDFIPRYFQRLEPFLKCSTNVQDPRGCISEIRIEGHTSSHWANSTTEEAYAKNLILSQERSRAVLLRTLEISDSEDFSWVRSRLAAVGFSSSRPITSPRGREDPDASRRVDFRIETTVRDQLMALIGEGDVESPPSYDRPIAETSETESRSQNAGTGGP